MNINLKQERRQKKSRKGLTILILLLFLIPTTYLIYQRGIKTHHTQENKDNTNPKYEDTTDQDISQPEEEETIKEPVEVLQVIEGQQAYIVVPGNINTKNPSTLILYSHGSNTTVTEDMTDPFMLDLQAYGRYFAKQNYIFAASNQHGVNWGNKASIQDTLNLKNWINENYNINEKVYLIGFSMGGLPTLNFTTTYPELVSKVALLAPSLKSSEWNQERANKVEDIDIKIWHGNSDVNVPYSYSTFLLRN